MKHEVYIAFDYRLKQTGVAIAQSITKTASPLLSLKMHNGEPDWEDIDSIFENFKPNYAKQLEWYCCLRRSTPR